MLYGDENEQTTTACSINELPKHRVEGRKPNMSTYSINVTNLTFKV